MDGFFLAKFNFHCVFRCILAPFCSFHAIGWFILFGLVCLSSFLWHCTGQDSLGITLISGLLKLLPPEQYSFCRQTTGAVVKPRESKVDKFIAAFFKFSERCLVTLNQERPKQPGLYPLWSLFSLLAIWYVDLSTWRLVLRMVRVCGLDSGYVINIFCSTRSYPKMQIVSPMCNLKKVGLKNRTTSTPSKVKITHPLKPRIDCVLTSKYG